MEPPRCSDNIFASLAKKRDESNIFSKGKNSINLFESRPSPLKQPIAMPSSNIFVTAAADNSLFLGDDSDSESQTVSDRE